MQVDLSPADIFGLPGEIVSGHPDRHVARVEVNGRVCYLKRQHCVGWRERLRNWRLGFGWVSKCAREAKVISALERAGFPHPECVAYWEDGSGRAFLLVAELSGVAELRDHLSDNSLSPQLGARVAELHAAGFTTPDLTAKHVFVEPLTLIDWQSAVLRRPTLAERVQSLAALHASLGDELASPRERFRFLREYLKVEPVAPFSEMVRLIARAAIKQAKRRSIRDQRQRGGCEQRLVWLAGETVCAVPEIAGLWPTPAVCAPFYGEPFHPESRIELADGRPATLLRQRTVAPLARFAARLRGRVWRSPGVTLGRILFHLERYGMPAPRLLAFGQRDSSAESFALFDPPRGVPLAEWLRHSHSADVKERCVSLLRKLHDAGCRLGSHDDVFRVEDGLVSVADPRAIRLDRKLNSRTRRADFARLAQFFDH